MQEGTQRSGGEAIGGKRKRDQDDEDLERLSQSTRRTTRSQGLAEGDAPGDQATNRPSPKVSVVTAPRKRTASFIELTETAVDRHNRMGRKSYFSRIHNGVRRWIRSIQTTSEVDSDCGPGTQEKVFTLNTDSKE